MQSNLPKAFLLFLIISLLNSQKLKPKLIIEMFRHGARSPLQSYDPYWFGKPALLTKVGCQMHIVQGAKLVQQYPHLYEVLQDAKRYFLRSTNTSRTFQSLNCHIWGMEHGLGVDLQGLEVEDYDFGLKFNSSAAYKQFGADLDDTTIIQNTEAYKRNKLRTMPFFNDLELMADTSACPRLFDYADPQEIAEYYFFAQPLTQQVNNLTGLNFLYTEFKAFYDVEIANIYEGRPVARGSLSRDSQLWKAVESSSEYITSSIRFSKPFQRKAMGVPLMKFIRDMLEASRDGIFTEELALISGHEVSLLNFLHALDILTHNCLKDKMHGKQVDNPLCHMPGYASRIIIELWEVDYRHKLKIIYDNDVVPFLGNSDGLVDLEDAMKVFDEASSFMPIDEVWRFCGKRFSPPGFPPNLKPVLRPTGPILPFNRTNQTNLPPNNIPFGRKPLPQQPQQNLIIQNISVKVVNPPPPVEVEVDLTELITPHEQVTPLSEISLSLQNKSHILTLTIPEENLDQLQLMKDNVRPADLQNIASKENIPPGQISQV